MTTTSDTQSVFTAISSVMEELPNIAKVPHPTQDGRGITYAYRGIEEITSEAQPLFAKYGLVFCPNVLDVKVKDIIVNGNPWTDTMLTVRYDIFGPSGDLTQVTTVGIGRDNSDKGANKAMTQAFKYALLQVFCIADSADDAEGTTHAADAHVPGRATQPDPADSRHPQQNLQPNRGAPVTQNAGEGITEKQGKALWAISGGGKKFNLAAVIERQYNKREADLTKREASDLIDGINSGRIDTSPQVAGAEQVAAAFGTVVQDPEQVVEGYGFSDEKF